MALITFTKKIDRMLFCEATQLYKYKLLEMIFSKSWKRQKKIVSVWKYLWSWLQPTWCFPQKVLHLPSTLMLTKDGLFFFVRFVLWWPFWKQVWVQSLKQKRITGVLEYLWLSTELRGEKCMETAQCYWERSTL